jgi:hypothetical protein
MGEKKSNNYLNLAIYRSEREDKKITPSRIGEEARDNTAHTMYVEIDRRTFLT